MGVAFHKLTLECGCIITLTYEVVYEPCIGTEITVFIHYTPVSCTGKRRVEYFSLITSTMFYAYALYILVVNFELHRLLWILISVCK